MHLHLTFDQWLVAGFFLVMAVSVSISIALDLREPPERDYIAEQEEAFKAHCQMCGIPYPGESSHFIG
jgi:hypothetical protein